MTHFFSKEKLGSNIHRKGIWENLLLLQSHNRIEGTDVTREQLKGIFPFGYTVFFFNGNELLRYEIVTNGLLDWKIDWENVKIVPNFADGTVAGVSGHITAACTVLLLLFATRAQAAERQVLRGHVPAVVAHLQPMGNFAGTNHLNLAIGLPLRNREALSNLLHQIYDPASPNYRHYLTPEQFTAQFGPTEVDYQKVIDFARQNGLTVVGTQSNRTLVEDLDGDGKPDLLVANSGDGTVSILRNTSVMGSLTTNSFAPQVVIVTGSGCDSVAVGDLDGDGKPDVVTANSGNNTVSLLRNISTPGSIPTSIPEQVVLSIRWRCRQTGGYWWTVPLPRWVARAFLISAGSMVTAQWTPVSIPERTILPIRWRYWRTGR
jgi:hypothetical protein